MISDDVGSYWNARLLACAVLLVGLVGVSSSVLAGDFDTASQEWNGLADVVALAQDEGLELNEVHTLDWREVSADDVVVVVYPTTELDVANLTRFVIDGGRVLLADDFGMSPSFLERLSIQRTEPDAQQLPHGEFVDDHPGWPRFSVRGEHSLIGDVDEVVANYPAVIHNVGGAVVSYDDDGGLIYDMMLGQGRAVVVADPGIFINAMLPVADNRQLAKNMIHYLCEDVEGCTGWLLVDEFATTGMYGEADTTREGVAEQVQRFNERMGELFDDLPNSDLLYFLALFLALGTLAYLATVFPWRRARLLSEYFDRYRRDLSPPLTEFDWNMERFIEPDGRINYALPVAILKESFEELFLEQFDLWPSKPGERPSVKGLAQRFDEQFCQGVAPATRKKRRIQVEQLLTDLATVPSRHRVFLESDEYFSARDMIRLHRRIYEVLEWMGLQEAYERRTREIDTRHLRPRRR